jgi:hypothetical protein
LFQGLFNLAHAIIGGLNDQQVGRLKSPVFGYENQDDGYDYTSANSQSEKPGSASNADGNAPKHKNNVIGVFDCRTKPYDA